MTSSLVGLARNRDGIAAVEFALVAPVFVALLGLLIDFAVVFNTQLRLAGALHAASQVAFAQGQWVTSSTASSLITAVANVATVAAGSTPVSVKVLVNNATDGSTADTFYCVSGGGTPVWSSTGTSSAGCGGALTSGKFVSISVSANGRSFFLPASFAAKIATLSDNAVVRVR